MALKYRILLLGGVFLILLSSIHILNVFPLPKNDILTEKSSGFSGVLRLWISEENSPASKGIYSWLNRESAQFEKKHDGVYVQITPVSKETLSSFSYAAELPPDMIVFSPGMLENTQSLVQVEIPSLLREEFQNYASGYCTPVAMGATLWAVRKGIDPPLSGKTLLFEKTFAYSALHALKADLPYQKTPGARYGVDLGLEIYEEEEITIEKTEEIAPGADSRIFENAHVSFIKGEADAVFFSLKELLTLINASAAPEFEIAMTGEMYTPLLSLFAVTDTKTGEAREMCEKFLHHLLSEDAQRRLESVKAFSVTGAQVYTGKAHFQEAEMLISSLKIHPAPAFSKNPEEAAELLQSIINGDRKIRELLP